MPTQNAAVVFVSTPKGPYIPGENVKYSSDKTVDLDNIPLNGGILTKAVSLGIDPYIHARMKFAYVPGQPIFGAGVGVVLRSEHEGYKPGDHVSSDNYPFEEYSVLPADAKLTVRKEGIPWSAYVGLLGLGGKTAWAGYHALVNAKKGETIYVSTASGSVGSLVCQLAKAEGLKVIASAGSAEKVDFLKEIGVDVAFNYKTQDLDQVLKENGPVDIFWDNVGGQTLERVLNHMNKWGTVIICGFSSQWTSTSEPYGVKNTTTILFKSLTVKGLNIGDILERFGDFDFDAGVTELIKEGKLKAKEQVSTNLADAPQLILDIWEGKNFGKQIINIA